MVLELLSNESSSDVKVMEQEQLRLAESGSQGPRAQQPHWTVRQPVVTSQEMKVSPCLQTALQ